MLGHIGFTILTFMLVIYVIGALLGLVCVVIYAAQKMTGQALKTMLYLSALTLSTVMSAVPFLRMHGSYADGEKLGILLFCLLNILLMVIFSISRIMALTAGHDRNQTS